MNVSKRAATRVLQTRGYAGRALRRPRRPSPGVVLVILVWTLCALPLFAHTSVDVQIQDLTRRIDRSPHDGDLYFQRAEMERSLGRWKAARADYDRAARLRPGLTGLDLARGTMWLEAGRPERALPLLERFLAAHPENPHGHLMKGRSLGRLRSWREAGAEYDRALALFTTAQPELYLERAAARTALGPEEIPAAIRGLNEGMERLGEAITLQLAAMDLEVRSKRYDDALARLAKIAARSPRPDLWRARREEILAARSHRFGSPVDRRFEIRR